MLRFSIGVPALGAMVFGSAGTMRFWQGWVFLALVLGTGLFSVVYFYHRDPELLTRRLRAREKIQEQRLIMKCWGMLYFLALVVDGLDYRFGWSQHCWVPCPSG
jgi:hypothetical protein